MSVDILFSGWIKPESARGCVFNIQGGEKFCFHQEALEDSPSPSEGLIIEKTDFAADSLEWCEQSTEGCDSCYEVFESLRHTGALSELNGDGENSREALLGSEDASFGWKVTEGGFCSALTKTRRRESVSAKDGPRETKEVYAGQCSGGRRKGPESYADPGASLKLCTRDSCPAETPACAWNTKTDFRQQPSSSPGALNQTQVESRTEPCNVPKSRHDTNTFEAKVKAPADTRALKGHVQLADPAVSETCVVHIDGPVVGTRPQQCAHKHNTWPLTKSTITESQKTKREGTFESYDALDGDELLSTHSEKKDAVLKSCDSFCGATHEKHSEALANVDRELADRRCSSKDEEDSNENLSTCYRTGHRVESKCKASAHIDVPDLTDAVKCNTNVEYTDYGLTANNTKPEFRATSEAVASALAQEVDCYRSQSERKEGSDRGLPAVLPAIGSSEEKACVRDVCFQKNGPTATEETKSPWLLNEICNLSEGQTWVGLPCSPPQPKEEWKREDGRVYPDQEQAVDTGPQWDHSDDEVFVKDEVPYQSGHPAPYPECNGIKQEDKGSMSSSPKTYHVRQIVNHGESSQDHHPFSERFATPTLSLRGKFQQGAEARTPTDVNLKGPQENVHQMVKLPSWVTQNEGRCAGLSGVREQTEVKNKEKASGSRGGRHCYRADLDPDEFYQQRRHKCLDDLWIEQQKKYKSKLAGGTRGSMDQLDRLLPERTDKTDAGVPLEQMEAFRGMPLMSHCFSHSTPIGLDCLGWRRGIFCEYLRYLMSVRGYFQLAIAVVLLPSR
ncbi:unnamed protein product [Menidia menidia]|uniref:(Atlantic silverside) hypothetical protein n=1 Tax=Menidia menidia TaxID=238744 RepID=A0A8S4APB7_9TELE|nr:unnamed protein product [Menidia menidia]CAG5896266.1 unnamed protein product [Menidia menidia]